MNNVIVLHNMPRSGGTLVSKCLAAMQSVVLLSEIHPDAQHAVSFNALLQAQKWYGYLPELNHREHSLIDAVIAIAAKAAAEQKHLIIRDWSHVDYLGPPVTDTPSMQPALLQQLQGQIQLQQIQLLRNPLDAWLSFKRLDLAKKHQLSFAKFIRAYRCYAQATDSNCQLYYDDFLKHPVQQLRRVCEYCGIAFDPSFIDTWFDYTNITGDNSNSSSLRKQQTIAPRAAKVVSEQLLDQAQSNHDYRLLMHEFFSE